MLGPLNVKIDIASVRARSQRDMSCTVEGLTVFRTC